MKIVDAHTGRHVQLGDVVPSPGREHDWRLLDVYDRFFSAEILIEELRPPRRQYWTSLTVRFFHPSFLFQRIGFVNS